MCGPISVLSAVFCSMNTHTPLLRMPMTSASAAFLSWLVVGGGAFKYTLEDEVKEAHTSYSEGWMYGAMDGPKIAQQGPAYINADLDITVTPLKAPSSGTFNISVMFYRSKVLDWGLAENLNICNEKPVVPSTFTDLEVVSFPVSLNSGDGDDTDLDQTFTASVRAHREITESGLQHCFIQVCPHSVGAKLLKTAGSLDFRNPYGFLPGSDYGCLPFEVFRVVGTIVLGAIFGYAMFRHRSSVLTVHKMIFGVIVLAALEAGTWWVAYVRMNTTGEPYCCPYPATVVLAMVMEVLRRTTSRFMLLMICLGYGITRISLERSELTAVLGLTVAFCGSGILQLASSVASASSVVGTGDKRDDVSPLLAVPALLFDMVFLSYIYQQLSNMLNELKEINETFKYNMYRALAWTLGTFVTLFTVLTVALLAAEGSQTQSWEWKFEWINVVSWEILNFLMLCTVATIWRPSSRSALLAYSKQLATNEVGAEEADDIELDTVEFQGPGGATFTIGEADDDEDQYQHEHDLDEAKSHGRGGSVVHTFEPQRHTDLT